MTDHRYEHKYVIRCRTYVIYAGTPKNLLCIMKYQDVEYKFYIYEKTGVYNGILNNEDVDIYVSMRERFMSNGKTVFDNVYGRVDVDYKNVTQHWNIHHVEYV